jgi:hypothetical protein
MFASAFYRRGDVYLQTEFEENGSVNSYELRTIQI